MRAPTTIVNALTSASGRRRSNDGPGHERKSHLHNGVDMGGVRGEPVLAIAAGRVVSVRAHTTRGPVPAVLKGGIVKADDFDMVAPYGTGLSVVIRHDGVRFPGLPGVLYTASHHLEDARVRPGQRVRAGQRIGSMGSSGTNPVGGAVHLHLGGSVGDSDEIGDRVCIDIRGLQHLTYRESGKGGVHVEPDPLGRSWRVGEVVVTRCFPKSGSPRGRIGVDGPAPFISARGGGFVRVPVIEATDLVVLAAGAALAYWLVT